MKVVLQRVSRVAVRVQGEVIARIGKGMMILIGIEKGDSAEQAEELARKVSQLRIFEDEQAPLDHGLTGQGKMNLGPLEMEAEVLVVSQFTLGADLSKGNRPSFDSAEVPDKARELIGRFVATLKATGLAVSEGQFGSRMEVDLINDGPVTFLLGTGI